jgi:hypothetical protein
MRSLKLYEKVFFLSRWILLRFFFIGLSSLEKVVLRKEGSEKILNICEKSTLPLFEKWGKRGIF